MTTFSSDDLAVLKRRVKELTTEYGPEYSGVFVRVADELQTRRRHETEGEAAMVDLVADNRRLRRVLNELMQFSFTPGVMPIEERDKAAVLVRRALTAQKEIGAERRLLTIEIVDEMTRVQVEANVLELLDRHYGPIDDELTHAAEVAAEEEQRGKEKDEKPVGAGRDADQRPGAEAGDRVARFKGRLARAIAVGTDDRRPR